MGFRELLTLTIVLWTAQIVFCEFWEFGHADVPDSVVIDHKEGTIGFFERTKIIPLTRSQCHIITYVKVNIYNLRKSPQVHYDNKMHTITISYGVLQNSKSSYDILTKAVWVPGCITPPQQQQYPQG